MKTPTEPNCSVCGRPIAPLGIVLHGVPYCRQCEMGRRITLIDSSGFRGDHIGQTIINTTTEALHCWYNPSWVEPAKRGRKVVGQPDFTRLTLEVLRDPTGKVRDKCFRCGDKLHDTEFESNYTYTLQRPICTYCLKVRNYYNYYAPWKHTGAVRIKP